MQSKENSMSAKKVAKESGGFTGEEKAAMKERAAELKREKKGKADGKAICWKIAEMPDPDRTLAERIHEIVKANTPELASRTVWHARLRQGWQGRLLLPGGG